MAQGRKAKYCEEKVTTICDALRNGETKQKAAKLADISEDTFYEWQNTKSEFSEAVKDALKDYEEWQRTELLSEATRSLKKLVCGMEYDEVSTETYIDPRTGRQVKKKKTAHKCVGPNPTAVIFTLCNRDPENWQNKAYQEVKGKIETEAKQNISLKNVPTELLEQVVDAIDGETE